MYTWPPSEELQFLIGYQLTAVRVSSWPVDLYFSKPPDVVISLSSRVHVQLPDGRIANPEHLPDAGVLLIGLIGATIISVERPSPHGVKLNFDAGQLVMDDVNDQFECYSIIGDGRAVYV